LSLQDDASAPQLICTVFDRWRRFHPDHEVTVIDRAGAEAILRQSPSLRIGSMSDAALSDVLRANLLLHHGGIWVDATLFANVPLDDWSPGRVAPTGWFAFDRPGPDRLISSWFIAATPDHPLLAAWWDEICRFWSQDRTLVKGTPADPVASVSRQAADGQHPY
jgi:mannosyltransferase OCH1-like enzyme